MAAIKQRFSAVLTICLDYCHSLLSWEGFDKAHSAFASAVVQGNCQDYLTMVYSNEVHTSQKIADVFQVSSNQEPVHYKNKIGLP